MTVAGILDSKSAMLRVAVAAAGATCVANATWWMQPVLMHDLISNRGYGEASAGLVLSVEMASMALGSAAIARIAIGRSLLLISLIGIAAAILGSLLSFHAPSYADLLFARALAGLGAGAGLMVSNTLATFFADPDKAFARLGVVNLLFGTALLAAMPLLPGRGIYAGPYLAILVAIAIMLVPSLFLRFDTRVPAPPATEAGPTVLARQQTVNILLLTLATLMIGVASGTIWAFYALIGEKAGMSVMQVDSAISTAVLTALGGAGLAALLGGRFGRLLPCCGALLTMSGAILVLSSGPTATMFRIATCVNISAIYFLMPYLFGAAAAQDSTGRGATYAASAFFFTGAISPALGGMLAATVGMEVVGAGVVVVALIAAAIMVRIERNTIGDHIDLTREGPVQALHEIAAHGGR